MIDCKIDICDEVNENIKNININLEKFESFDIINLAIVNLINILENILENVIDKVNFKNICRDVVKNITIDIAIANFEICKNIIESAINTS